MHPEFTAMIAHQRVAEATKAANAANARGRHAIQRHRPSLRTRIGWTLTRWGTRLAPTPSAAGHQPRPARLVA